MLFVVQPYCAAWLPVWIDSSIWDALW